MRKLYRQALMTLLLTAAALAQTGQMQRTFSRAGQQEGTLTLLTGANGAASFTWTAKQTVVPTFYSWRVSSSTASNSDLAITLELGYFISDPDGNPFFIRSASATLGAEAAHALRDGLNHAFPTVPTPVAAQ